jgi:hypothetical protein
LIYKDFISISETTLRQHLAILNNIAKVCFFLAGSETTFTLGETTQNQMLSQQNQSGAACRAVRQQRQLNNTIFAYYEKNRQVSHNKTVPGNLH